MMMADVVGEKNFVIDISTPETLERDFYAWLYGDEKTSGRHLERLPPIDDLAFGGRDLFPSPDDLSDGGSFAGSPPSSTSSESNDYRSPSESELRRESVSSCPSRSSGTNQLGRIYSPGLPLSMSEREQIVSLYKGGWKICDISKRLCITHSCVSKILNRYRTTGSVKPKDAKEGRTESPLVTAIRDYRMRLGMSRQAEIREQLIADGICSRENAPSRSSINHILRTKLDMKKRRKPT
uniref:Paired domain-containing protein n=1 Tax=Wuchereria bancrofti TaxID=6293 RepID=A0AAF5PK83_WUCBA